SLAESVGTFNPEKFAEQQKGVLNGSGLLYGDTSKTLMEGKLRAEKVLEQVGAVLRGEQRKVGTREEPLSSEARNFPLLQTLQDLSTRLKRALFMSPNEKRLYAMRGEVHKRMQDLRTAVYSLRLVVRMDSSSLPNREKLATCLQSQQGMVWMDAGEYTTALNCFEEACLVDAFNSSFHINRVVACIKLRRYTDALKLMESVMGCRRATADDLVLRAKIHWALGMVRP
ncbi:unnamed protein product, partial [Choristocarpus tenellus]